MVLWGRSMLGCQEVLRKVRPRFREGSTKVLSRFHHGFIKVSPRFRWVCFTKVPHLSLKWLLFQKRFLAAGFRQLFFTFNSQSRSGVKVAWVVDMSHPYLHLQSAENNPPCRCCWGILWVYSFSGLVVLNMFVGDTFSFHHIACLLICWDGVAYWSAIICNEWKYFAINYAWTVYHKHNARSFSIL